MSAAAPTRRFSLLSLVLLMTTIGAVAGWIGAVRQASEARRETLTLRRDVERYRAELGELHVVDTTRVHAIGLRRDPQDKDRWKWRVYLPRHNTYQLVLEADRRQLVEIPNAGELVIEAQLAGRVGEPWSLSLAVNGAPLLTAALPGYGRDTALIFTRFVGPNDRSVWEQAERPVLIETRFASSSDQQRPDVEEGGREEAAFAIWIETKTPRSAVPPDD